jgi:FolB domain-containing protein
MDKVIIRDLVARGVIGVNEWERKVKQEILINVMVFTDMRRAAVSDHIQDCVDYRALSKKLLAYAESAGTMTVEALANRLADLCLEDPLVQRAIVRVEKPGAVRFAASVGVQVERSRDE